MRFGVFSVLDTYPEYPKAPPPDRYEETLGFATFAESLGYDSFWVAEHHFRGSGVLPSPPVWLAAAARETHRIRLGSLVAVLPLHSPREMAEQYALVDRLCAGRLDIGLGSGYVPLEFQGFGIPTPDRRADFESALPEFLAALQGSPLSAPGAPDGVVSINVRPIQRPTPPIWIAAMRREAIRSVGARGGWLALVPYATLGSIEELPELVALYRDALPRGSEGRVLAAVHVLAGPDRERDERALERFLHSRPLPESEGFRSHLAAHPQLESASELIDRGFVIDGTEESLEDQLRRLERAGVTDVAGIFDFGGRPPRDVHVALERVAAVRPRFLTKPHIATTPIAAPPIRS